MKWLDILSLSSRVPTVHIQLKSNDAAVLAQAELVCLESSEICACSLSSYRTIVPFFTIHASERHLKFNNSSQHGQRYPRPQSPHSSISLDRCGSDGDRANRFRSCALDGEIRLTVFFCGVASCAMAPDLKIASLLFSLA